MPFFQVSDGTRLSYEDYGAGAPVVFVSSWALHADMWEYQVPFFLEHGFRCALLDRRGHGRSDRPSSGYDVNTRSDDLAALIEHLDLRDITLVAHSAGGGEAARYLSRHGEERVSRVAFLASTVPFLKRTEDNPEGLPEAGLEATLAQFRKDRPKWFADRAQGYFATHLGNDVSPALVENEVRRCLSAAPFAAAEVFRSTFHEDFRPDLRQVTVPALIVHGVADQSALIDVTGRRTRKLIPHAVYREYPTAGHGLYVTHAEQLNADILAFVNSYDGSDVDES
ncbi:alpha/beta fold hydrolase [Amycolatopsis taiwanensis]|uniref:alpha/beta fold hydrolase n=1 Tax=Amycolatopsis taiwanensis TaxID=342230 RepID=UPI000487258E|nr:alpha/beta hydrolase [Amycolatopsis taiwanensis]